MPYVNDTIPLDNVCLRAHRSGGENPRFYLDFGKDDEYGRPKAQLELDNGDALKLARAFLPDDSMNWMVDEKNKWVVGFPKAWSTGGTHYQLTKEQATEALARLVENAIQKEQTRHEEALAHLKLYLPKKDVTL